MVASQISVPFPLNCKTMCCISFYCFFKACSTLHNKRISDIITIKRIYVHKNPQTVFWLNREQHPAHYILKINVGNNHYPYSSINTSRRVPHRRLTLQRFVWVSKLLLCQVLLFRFWNNYGRQCCPHLQKLYLFFRSTIFTCSANVF